MSSQQAPLALQVHCGCSCCHTRLTAHAHTHTRVLGCSAHFTAPPSQWLWHPLRPVWTLSRGHGTTLLCVPSKDIQDFFLNLLFQHQNSLPSVRASHRRGFWWVGDTGIWEH